MMVMALGPVDLEQRVWPSVLFAWSQYTSTEAVSLICRFYLTVAARITARDTLCKLLGRQATKTRRHWYVYWI